RSRVAVRRGGSPAAALVPQRSRGDCDFGRSAGRFPPSQWVQAPRRASKLPRPLSAVVRIYPRSSWMKKRTLTRATAAAAVLALALPVLAIAGQPGQTVELKTTITINPYGSAGKVS